MNNIKILNYQHCGENFAGENYFIPLQSDDIYVEIILQYDSMTTQGFLAITPTNSSVQSKTRILSIWAEDTQIYHRFSSAGDYSTIQHFEPWKGNHNIDKIDIMAPTYKLTITSHLPFVDAFKIAYMVIYLDQFMKLVKLTEKIR